MEKTLPTILWMLVVFIIAGFLIIIGVSTTHAQSLSNYKQYVLEQDIVDLYYNDSLVIESTRYSKDIMVVTNCEDRTLDGIYFTLHKNTYILYNIYDNTIYRVYSKMESITVADHFLLLLNTIRNNRLYCQNMW